MSKFNNVGIVSNHTLTELFNKQPSEQLVKALKGELKIPEEKFKIEDFVNFTKKLKEENDNKSLDIELKIPHKRDK